jgi:hypothetical protein
MIEVSDHMDISLNGEPEPLLYNSLGVCTIRFYPLLFILFSWKRMRL